MKIAVVALLLVLAFGIEMCIRDSMGGLPAILRNFHPTEFWVGNNPRSVDYVRLLDEAAELRIPIRSLREGDAFAFADTSVAVLAPMKGYEPGAEPTNDDSLVLHVAYCLLYTSRCV